ncbi:MAG: trypsin-like peptidase domain-containing protein [Candidatus Electrothrix aestuarii]|uniref:Trypsin-like peptidase domain-containing protein n=1 Tax=Candidatus Electrothrix aestuarii TaxID=3062594 RepID=A0AAU8LRT6_9BACT|nr:trypsin-like peptidase domain-containing protein [Candidatus Electrothrix aestuarii]
MPSSSLESSLVRILTDSGPSRRAFGVGFLVTPKHIMTCAHVVNDALGESQNNPNRPDAEIILDFPLVKNQPLLRAKILHWLPGQEDNSGGDIQDIAVLELLADTPLPSSLHPAALVLTEQQEGSQAEAKVRMCGFPEGTDQGTYTNGLLQGVTAGGLIEIHCRDYPLAPDGEQQQQTYSIKELQEQWKLLAEKLQALEKDHILETRSEERLRLEHRIKETRTDRDTVEQQLTALQNADIVEPDKKASCKSGFDGTPVWAVQENAVCGMVLTMQNRHNKVVTSMIPATQLIAAFPEMEQLSRPANPYLGLEAFGEKDALLYFGRTETVARIQRIVGEQDFVAVIGASGSGKSSAVFAGLVPILRRTGNWLIARCLPRKQPFYELSSALVPFLYDDPLLRLEKSNELREKLHAGSLALSSIVHQISGQNNNQRFLLIIDQFEELFTLNTDRELISRYIESLLEARHTENFTVLITMRADFLESAAGYPALAEALSHCPPFIIPPMSEKDLREAVEQPAAMFGVEFDPGLAQLIVQDVGSEPGSLPLLEFCLTQLWERQEFRRISHDAYTAIGGVQQALANHADEVYAEFDEQDKDRLRHIFLKLVRPGQGTEDTRQVATLEQIRPENREVITRLADHRLVVTGRVEEEDTVEVVHEALIRRWQTLRQWVDEDREFLVWQEKLRVLLRQWQESGKDEGALLRGLPLDEALKWRKTHAGHLDKEELEFIENSEQLREQELRKKKEQEAEREAARQARERQRKINMAILSVGLLVALALSGVAGWQWWEAKQQKVRADRARTEAEENGRNAQLQLAMNYWNNGIQEQKNGDLLTALHYFALTEKGAAQIDNMQMQQNLRFTSSK